MLRLRISLIFCIIGTAASQAVGEDEQPFLRVIAPQFICNKKEIQPQNNNVTVGLQTREGQRLRYKISIDFEMIDGQFKSQQHTLSIWKNIRLLQKKFNDESEKISLKNQIEINSKELTSQVIYTFKITGFDDKNRSSEVQNFTITYKGGELKTQQSDLGDGVSLLLLSSEFLYDDMEMLAVAEISFCDPINDYSFRWKIKGIESSEAENVIGSTLRLSVGSLRSGQVIEIIVSALNNESLTMSSATLPIKVLAKDFQVQNTPSECSIGVSREVLFQAFLYRQPNAEVSSEKWTCLETGQDECSASFINSTTSSQLMMFSSEGNYELQSEVSINNVTKTSISKIGVNGKIIPNVQVKYFPPQPFNIMESLEIVVTVLNLVPKCFAYWNILEKEGFATFKTGVESENFINMGMIFIKDFEEYFLQELVDYDNNTLSKDIKMTLPGDVLLPNENYKFRLTIGCPEPVTEVATQAEKINITSFYDVTLATNSPPQVLPLVVSPLNGIAMKTTFKFLTGAAEDSSIDYPLKYTFGYVVNNLTVEIGSFYENTAASTQLPFSDTVETFFKACDNNGACAKVSGQTISANSDYKYTDKEIEFKLSEFDATLKRAEYAKSLNVAVIFLLTQSKFAKDTSMYEKKMLEMVKNELGKLKASESSGFVYNQKVIEFIKASKDMIGLMTISDEAFVEDLLSLTETINNSQRSKRSTFSNKVLSKVMNHDSDYMKNVLSLSEMLLKSNNVSVVQREKGKFVDKVHQFVSNLCQEKNLNTHTISTKSVIFEVSKVFSPQLAIEPQLLPGKEKATILYAMNGNFPANYVCVGKIRFSFDMFDEKSSDATSVFETIVLGRDEVGNSKAILPNELSESVTIEIAADPSMTCKILRNTGWSDACERLRSNATRVVCKCRTNGNAGVVVKAEKMQLNPTEPPAVTTHQETPLLSTRTTQSYDETQTVSVSLSTSENSASTLSSPIEIFTTETTKTKTFNQITEATASFSTVSEAETKPRLEITATSESSKIQSKSSVEPKSSTLGLKLTTEIAFLTTSQDKTTKTPSINLPAVIPANASSVNESSAYTTNVNDASSSWTLIFLLLVFFLLIIALFSFHKCRKFANSQTNLPHRNPSSTIKYAKYHDEFTMRG